ncbi:hypothetical protein EV421DRAFT_1792990 [Armillaria borealis]|uniref:C2H2-type domain-containing protein n=1 Tax=Armillaria borealis TaxID=47425 RepID=A0AA39JQY2_9AGAR|nr:hypothetical protein EV421DRAFT_1792990 [Armillaria borealis]
MAGMTEDISCQIFIEDAEGHHQQLDDDDLRDQHDSSSSYTDGSISPLSPASPYGYPVSEEPPRYMDGGQNIPLGRTRRSSETALTAVFPPSFGARDRSASVNGHQRHLSSPATPFAVNRNESFPYSDFLTPPLYQRHPQPSLQVNTDIPFGFCSPPPGSASPGLTPASSVSSSFASPEEYRPQSSGGYSDHSDLSVVSPPHESNVVDNPYQPSTSLLLHPEDSRGRTLWRLDDDYLTPGSNSRSLSLVSMPNLGDLDHDFFNIIRSPSVAPSTHSDSGIDSSDILAHLDLNPSVVTSDIFGDIPEQQTSRLGTDASLSPTSYREQVASDAVARASQSRRTNAANYTCSECHQTFTAKHNLNNHVNSHYGVRNFHCQVPNCNKAFGTSHVRRRHMIKCHSESAEAKKRKTRKRLS